MKKNKRKLERTLKYIILIVLFGFILSLLNETNEFNSIKKDINRHINTINNQVNTINNIKIFNKKQVVYDNISIKPYFCNEVSCIKVYSFYLNQTKNKTYCAFYNLNSKRLEQVLNKLCKNHKYIGVYDKHAKMKICNISIRNIKEYGIMHNKFCIIDNKTIITGSFNPVDINDKKTYDNIIIINSTKIAKHYYEEFNKFMNKQFGNNKKTNELITFKDTIKNITINIYFCPEDHCENNLINEIQKSNFVYFMVYSFTSKEIAKKLMKKYINNQSIKGILEKSQISKYTPLNYFIFPFKIEKTKKLLHNKIFILNNTITSGSYNPTKSGNFRNDENLIIIKDNKIFKIYLNQFNKLWNKIKD